MLCVEEMQTLLRDGGFILEWQKVETTPSGRTDLIAIFTNEDGKRFSFALSLDTGHCALTYLPVA